MFGSLNPSDFWEFWLFIGLIIDNLNNIVNNLDRFVFLEYQKIKTYLIRFTAEK